MGNDAHRTGDHYDLTEPDEAAAARDRNAEDRDRRAESHDRESKARDDRADARDDRAEAREGADSPAAADRLGAWRDRRGGASDRTEAADDRRAAKSDRFLSARQRSASSIDQLTRAHRREPGMVELERELLRAKRTQRPFTLVFVDVDDLKGMNDSHGHIAGDRLLRETADAIRAHLRSYDLIVRFGGDEFLCGLLDMSKADAAERFALVNADLAETHNASVTVGLAELEADDSLESLIAHADQVMYRARQQSRGARA